MKKLITLLISNAMEKNMNRYVYFLYLFVTCLASIFIISFLRGWSKLLVIIIITVIVTITHFVKHELLVSNYKPLTTSQIHKQFFKILFFKLFICTLLYLCMYTNIIEILYKLITHWLLIKVIFVFMCPFFIKEFAVLLYNHVPILMYMKDILDVMGWSLVCYRFICMLIEFNTWEYNDKPLHIYPKLPPITGNSTTQVDSIDKIMPYKNYVNKQLFSGVREVMDHFKSDIRMGFVEKLIEKEIDINYTILNFYDKNGTMLYKDGSNISLSNHMHLSSEDKVKVLRALTNMRNDLIDIDVTKRKMCNLLQQEVTSADFRGNPMWRNPQGTRNTLLNGISNLQTRTISGKVRAREIVCLD